MNIGPIFRIDVAAPVSPSAGLPDWTANDRQVVTAVQRLNETQWLGPDREFTYRREQQTGRFVIQIRERQTGDIVDQIPPESIIRLLAELQQSVKSKD